MKLVSFISFLLFISCLPKGNQSSLTDAGTNLEQKFLYSIHDCGDEMKQFAKQNEMEFVDFVDENMFLSKEKYKVDTVKFEKAISQKFPDKNQHGYCYINLESPYLEKIRDKEKIDDEFIKAQEVFID